jgi:hypothetical protein
LLQCRISNVLYLFRSKIESKGWNMRHSTSLAGPPASSPPIVLLGVAALALSCTAVRASETNAFTYDAEGQLVQVARSGTVNSGVTTIYAYDLASNRYYKWTGTGTPPTTPAAPTLPPPPPPPPPPPSFAISDVEAEEGNSLVFTVTKTGTTALSHTISYATEDQAAIAGSDYTATSGTLTFASGETSKTITVSTIEDGTIEPHESMYVVISQATNGALISDVKGEGAILNDDGNQPPVANEDLFYVDRCSTGDSIAVLYNDTDPEGNTPLTVTAISAGIHGTTSIGGGGTHIVYVPYGYNAFESLTYTVRDSLGATSQGSLVIQVQNGSCGDGG